MQEKEKKDWGGAREGAGRKKKYVKPYYFNATEEVMAILENVPSRERTDFINQCILKGDAIHDCYIDCLHNPPNPW